MPKLIIQRKSEPNNKARKITIYIDEKMVGTLANGETRAYDLELGSHEVFAKIDWFGSKKVKVDVTESPTHALKLSGFKYGTWVGLIIIGLILGYFIGRFRFDEDLDFLLVLAGITFMYPLYFITIGRNRYLKLKEVEIVRS